MKSSRSKLTPFVPNAHKILYTKASLISVGVYDSARLEMDEKSAHYKINKAQRVWLML